MDLNRRIVMLSLGLAAAAGLAFPAILTRSAEPQLVQPLTISDVAATGGGASSAAQDVPMKPVPVVPRGERDDNARTNVDDDEADDPRDDGDDDSGDGRTDDGGGGGGDDSAPGGDDSDDGGSSDG